MSLFILEYYFVPSFFLNIGFHSYLSLGLGFLQGYQIDSLSALNKTSGKKKKLEQP